MFLILLYTLCLTINLPAAEKPRPSSGVMVKIQLDAEPLKPSEELLLEVAENCFKTIGNAIEELGADQTIPIHNVTQPTFKCLAALAKIVYEDDGNIERLKQKFDAIILQTPNRSYADIINAANYLDFRYTTADKKKTIDMIKEIAHLFAGTFKYNPFTALVKNSDEQVATPELQLIAPGWLLYNLLTMEKFKMKLDEVIFYGTFRPGLKVGTIYEPGVSNSSVHGNFVCLQRDAEFDNLTQCSYFNLRKKEITTEKLHIITNPNSKCAISSDGQYLVIAAIINFDCKITAHNLVTGKTFEPISIGVEPGKNAVYTVNTVLYNSNTQSFSIIIDGRTPNQQPEIRFYEIDAKTIETDMQIVTMIFKSSGEASQLYHVQYMHWSCIESSLVGVVNPSDPRSQCVLYDQIHKKLFPYSYNEQSKSWHYQGDDNTQKYPDAPFSLIPIAHLSPSQLNRHVAIAQSFIPHFNTIVLESINTELPGATWYKYFDAQNICLNFLTLQLAGLLIQTPQRHLCRKGFDPRLIAGIQLLNHTVNSGNKNILPEAYFLYHYHVNPTKWKDWCAPIWHLISPEMKKIFGLENSTLTSARASQSTLTRIKQNIGAFLTSSKQNLQSLYSQYKTPLVGSVLIVGGGLAAWLMSRYKGQLPIQPTAPRSMQPAGQSLISARLR